MESQDWYPLLQKFFQEIFEIDLSLFEPWSKDSSQLIKNVNKPTAKVWWPAAKIYG